jgi:Fur family zinc uptake transcriptional regulator
MLQHNTTRRSLEAMTRPHSGNDDAVLKALLGSGKPLSAYAILDKVRRNGIRAPMQVYRALDKLQSSGLVHRIGTLSAFIACRRRERGHKPGFVICRRCGTVREFDDRKVDGIASRAAGEGFAVDEVSIEVLGFCRPCRGRAGR